MQMAAPKYLTLEAATEAMMSLVESVTALGQHVTHDVKEDPTPYPATQILWFEKREITDPMPTNPTEEDFLCPRLDLHVGWGFAVWVSGWIPIAVAQFLEKEYKCEDVWGDESGAKHITLRVRTPEELEKTREILVDMVGLIAGIKTIDSRRLAVVSASHPRLGKDSPLSRLDPSILAYIARHLMRQGIY